MVKIRLKELQPTFYDWVIAIGASSEFKLVKPSCEQLTNVKIGTYDIKSNSQEDVPCLQ